MTKSRKSSLNFTIILVISIIVLGALTGIYLFTNSSKTSLGGAENPYDASLGYQGAGYYNYKGTEIYANSASQLNYSKTQIPTSSSTYVTTSVPATTTIASQINYGCSPLPCTYLTNGNNRNFTFVFRLLNRSVEQWFFPLTVYNFWVSKPRVDPILHLNNTITGKPIYTWDYRSLITPSFFANVTNKLTNGKNAGQFVAEVQNINSQLVNYSLVFENTSVYPAQLLAQGQGDCKDKGALIASILEAGNIEANYGMKIQFVYVDADNLTAPRTANHLMLYIIYSNGTKKFLDTTHVLATSPYFNGTVDGWYFNLTCTMNGCNSTPLCSGAYCDAVGYASGSTSRFNYCSSGYVVSANNTCQLECGAYHYCNSGSSCYNNKCVSCNAGYVLGSDGLCHTQCGNGYCNTGAYCYNNQCVTCPSGDYLGTDGYCHPNSGYSTTIPYTTTISSSGSGSCSSFGLTESSAGASTSSSCNWSGGYLTLAYSTGQLVAITLNITNNNGFTSNINANNSRSYPLYCLSNSQSEYLPSGTYYIKLSTGASGATCSNSYAYVTLSS